ncbi:MAG: biopolymer transporter ExbD [Mariprofundaceae bacterium]|nr:biopolymer transporter ExbD [Mariprofundaceae bacterium]
MKLRDRKRDDFMVEMTPLVDVVFLMLIFFMVSTSFNVSDSLKLELPSSTTATEDKSVAQVLVSIDASGQLYVQEEAVEDGELRRRILNISKGDPNMRVVLRADAETRHKRVVYVMDTVRGLGMGKLAIATIPISEK